ncbi:glutamate racemase [Leptospira gomenensis]|uniref:Glutamate racemase n=2 Tax=Leptospira gomenensis TaxID=2484974 RepID=A0A5F1YJX2_9LEPT|nr:glutamate racemase [Leptospira gomenensis]TGK34913.1 glutamate racemase [Leptospira gomenensis]TGK38525.1 glutamate racemase [Leptospira gomenensis]TGK42088.1 glutamate racemase [Leptospira gomenensis]TGK56350.1 glutamate racemase [Leptospira gomenensis]
MDSGTGGLSVLKEILKYDAELEVLYYGDLYNSPYGEKDASVVLDLTRNVCLRLVELGARAILLACNTATSAAAETLRKEFAIPIFGMEPAIKPAVLKNPGAEIALLATPVTQKEEKLQRLKKELNAENSILPISCPGLAGLVDQGDFEKAEAYLFPILEELKRRNVKAIVLGCTHYVFLKHIVLKLYPQAELFDGNAGTVRHLFRSLSVKVLPPDSDQGFDGRKKNSIHYQIELNTDDEDRIRFAERLLNDREGF